MRDELNEIRGCSSYHTNNERNADIEMMKDMLYGGTSGCDYRSVSRGLEKIVNNRMNVHGYYEY